MAWATTRTCPKTRAAKRSCSPPGPNRWTRISARTTAWTDRYLQTVDRKYELGHQGRNLRREANIPASKRAKFVLKPSVEIAPHDAEVLKLLLNAESLTISIDYQPAKGTPSIHSDVGTLFLPLEGLVDVEAEKARLQKELQKTEAEIEKVQQKLNNPNFTGKAPAHVLQEHQQRLAEWQAKRDRVLEALARLGS